MVQIDQRILNPELVQLLEKRQSSLNIVHTTKTPSGTTLDWVPIESQAHAGEIASPPPTPETPALKHDELKLTNHVRFELDDPAIERGPKGTVPIVRPDLSGLTRKVSVQDYLAKRGGSIVNKQRRNKKPTDPYPYGYFHAISSQSSPPPIYGCEGWLNVWDPQINDPAGNGDHSIMQCWLQNYDTVTQSIEAGLTVDVDVNGDIAPHLFTYYTTNHYAQDGDSLGGYNTIYQGWYQYSPNVFPGIRINGTSTQGGTQFDVFIKFQLYQGNWWFGIQGAGSFEWIGCYPGALFPLPSSLPSGGLRNYAEWLGWGGEVYSSLPDPSSTQDQMGSGRQAQEGWTHAAFQRNLRYQSDNAGTMVDHSGVAQTDTATGGGANPYDIDLYMNSGTSWSSYFYVGGPTP